MDFRAEIGCYSEAMAVGHANEPVMLAQLANVLHDEANADIALTALGEVGLVV